MEPVGQKRLHHHHHLLVIGRTGCLSGNIVRNRLHPSIGASYLIHVHVVDLRDELHKGPVAHSHSAGSEKRARAAVAVKLDGGNLESGRCGRRGLRESGGDA
jgi:hypothetical protein